MEVDFGQLEVYGVVVVPLILALVEGCKRAGLPAKYSPLLALVLGLVAGVFLLHPGDLAQGVVVGVAVGLAATGLYSGSKNVKEGVEQG